MDPTTFLEKNLKDIGLITGVPCSFFKGFINAAINSGKYVPAIDEGAAIAIATGYQIATGKNALVLMQNSGIGNAISPLTSLNYVFREPITMMVSHRGENDEPQHELMGQIDTKLLNLCQIDTIELNGETQFECAKTKSLAYIIPKGTFDECQLKVKNETLKQAPRHYLNTLVGSNPNGYARFSPVYTKFELLTAIKQSANECFDRYVMIATTGYTGRELFEISDDEHNLYMVGSMGCAMSLGLGMAIGDPTLKVIILDGDGALLMRTGTMGTIGDICPPNLIHICFNNGEYDTTGKQSRGCSKTLLHDLAIAFGYDSCYVANSPKGLSDIFSKCLKTESYTTFIELPVLSGHEKVGRPTLKPFEVKKRLMSYIQISKENGNE